MKPRSRVSYCWKFPRFCARWGPERATNESPEKETRPPATTNEINGEADMVWMDIMWECTVKADKWHRHTDHYWPWRSWGEISTLGKCGSKTNKATNIRLVPIKRVSQTFKFDQSGVSSSIYSGAAIYPSWCFFPHPRFFKCANAPLYPVVSVHRSVGHANLWRSTWRTYVALFPPI